MYISTAFSSVTSVTYRLTNDFSFPGFFQLVTGSTPRKNEVFMLQTYMNLLEKFSQHVSINMRLFSNLFLYSVCILERSRSLI